MAIVSRVCSVLCVAVGVATVVSVVEGAALWRSAVGLVATALAMAGAWLFHPDSPTR